MPDYTLVTTIEITATYRAASEALAVASHNEVLHKSQVPKEAAAKIPGITSLKYKDHGTVKPEKAADLKMLKGGLLSQGNQSTHPEDNFHRVVEDEF